MWCAIAAIVTFRPVYFLHDEFVVRVNAGTAKLQPEFISMSDFHPGRATLIPTLPAGWNGILFVAVTMIAAVPAPAAAIQRIQISADSIEGNGWLLTRPSAAMQLGVQSGAEIRAGAAAFGAAKVDRPAISCPVLVIASGKIECRQGAASLAGKAMPFTFSYDLKRSNFNALSRSDSGERWAIDGVAAEAWTVMLDIRKGEMKRFAGWFSAVQPRPNAGDISGTVRAEGRGATVTNATADIKLSDVAFSDSAGLKAGEKLNFAITAEGKGAGDGIDWAFTADYLSGEIFWQPVYVAKGGHRMAARGTYENGALGVAEAKAIVADVGEASLSAALTISPLDLKQASLKTGKLNAGPLFDTFIKPFLDQSTLGEASVKGSVSIEASVKSGQLDDAQLIAVDLTLSDPRGRYAVNRLNLTLPWRRAAMMQADVTFDSASLLNVPIGRVAFPVFIDENSFRARNIAIPILDGRLDVGVLEGEKLAGLWSWKLSGKLKPVSMELLTTALKLPVMKGVLSGDIPDMIYARQILAVNGELEIGAFDGTVRGRNIALLEPLGRAPRFLGDFEARNLDLGLLTSTFAFGRMEGRIDLALANLELANWRPVRFDAELKSSPGDYTKKISQQAVQNISSLGGAGAAAAIQRSMLSFFEQFGYSKLGLTCKLRNGVCEMGGVEDSAQGYVIVKGGGIPAITVMGYNRNVSWDTLVSRVQGAISSNAEPVVR